MEEMKNVFLKSSLSYSTYPWSFRQSSLHENYQQKIKGNLLIENESKIKLELLAYELLW